MFSIRHDLAYPAFCQACPTGKSLMAMSTDGRYCHECYDFAEGKAAELPGQSQQTTISPEGCGKTTLGIRPSEAMPRSYTPPALSLGHHGGGRPRKALPLDLIKEPRQDGRTIRAIASRLAAQGMAVSPRTIGRVRKGARIRRPRQGSRRFDLCLDPLPGLRPETWEAALREARLF